MKLLYIRWPLHWPGQRPSKWLPKMKKTDYYLRVKKVTFCLTWRPFHGLAPRAVWRVWPVILGVDPPTATWETPCMKKKTAVGAGGDDKHLAPLESAILKDALSLVEHCAVRKYDDGDPRVPGYFTVGTSGASWTVTVKDPDSCSSFRVVAQTLDQALETAALLLACEEAPWEHDRFLNGQQSKKRK